MTRYCFFCAGPIAEEKLEKNPAKVKFCSDSCRAANGRELAERKRAKKLAMGKCGACGRSFGKQPQEGMAVRVPEAVQ